MSAVLHSSSRPDYLPDLHENMTSGLYISCVVFLSLPLHYN